MSKSQNPMTGQMKGSMANFITTTRKGENEIRSKAFNAKDAKTPAQLLHRKCFKLISDENQALGGITSESFPEKTGNQTGYSQFMAANLSSAIDKSGAEPVIDYTKLIVASGSLPQVVVSEAKIEPSGLNISYLTNVRIPKINADDQVVVLAKTQIGELLLETQERTEAKEASILVDYPGITAADIKCCYLYVLSADGNQASQSVYVSFK